MRQVLLLGASGFIGRQCVKRLISYEGVIVHAVSRARPHWAEEIMRSRRDGKLVWHEHNLLNIGAIHPLIYEVRPDLALHTAWFVGHGAIWNAPDNLDWTAVTLSLARSLVTSGCSRIVIAGSCAEYSGTGTFTEETVSVPETLYGKSKNSARVLVQTLCSDSEVSFAWPRLFHMYGPYENEKRLISSAINALLDNKDFPCSDGQQVRDFLHVEDVADVLVKLLLSNVSGVINIGSGKPTTLAALLKCVGEAIGQEDRVRLGMRPRAINDPDILIPDITRQIEELRWSPTHSIETGIKSTVDWWKLNRAMTSNCPRRE